MSGDQPHTPIEAAHALTWHDAKCPGDWTPVERHFRAGHRETWWAADVRLGGYRPDSPCRLVVATTDPARLPEKATWYLATNLSHPDAPHAATGPHPPADLSKSSRPSGHEQRLTHVQLTLTRRHGPMRDCASIRTSECRSGCGGSAAGVQLTGTGSFV